MSPPTASIASAMSRADRVSVPLNSRCSRKCEAPASSGASSRDPASTQKPVVTEWASGMHSVTTRIPLSRRPCRMRSGKGLPRAASSVAPGPAAIAVVADERERDLALRVDVVDAHRELVAQVDHVLDPLDPLAAAQLGDVDQAVASREDVHEGAELGDVHHPARVDSADLGLG